MSWSCDVCYKGREADHTECKKIKRMDEQNEELSNISFKLDKIIELLEKLDISKKE